MMSDEITQENELEINSNNQNQEPKEVEKMPLNNIQKAKELKNNVNLKPLKQKSQISLVFGMNALVPLGTI